MWQENYNSELYHHGVKGMKWGVRRARQTTSSPGARRAKKPDNFIVSKYKKYKKVKEQERKKAAAAKREKQRKDAETKARIETSKKKPYELSDAELRERLARLELEKRYSDLLKQSKQNTASKGKQFVSTVLSNSGQRAAEQLTTRAFLYVGNKTFDAVVKAIEGNNNNKRR